MKHPSEPDLVEAYYQDRAASLKPHLETCPDCRSLYRDITELLDAARASALPVRGPGYGREVWARLQPHLPVKRRKFAWLLAPLTAALLTVFFVEHTPPPEPKTDRVLYLAMSDHLQHAQVLLTELAHNAAPDREREQARDLITHNRILRQRALHANDMTDAAVLDDLERVLLQVANGDSNLEAVRQRVEDGNLLLRVRISSSNTRIRGEKL